ncbi:hypothetical protein BUALT_Bualt13G0101500 [Buddleja alternifolia]|uniref:Polymerase nucleotidyl transferase domain-containing protein n=1 Tax=Buddleja alternifolia TaxID=168488 RepID=A0AAV6WN02_9LAMI|nr:hypothetical protein BUALT_Bualt13G0101500 [Buddleja alternifolia]
MCEFGVSNSNSDSNDSKEGERLVFGLGRNNNSCPRSPDPASFKEECLSAAEEAANQVLNCIHPTLDSEEKRCDVIDYIQRLVKTHLNSQVFPYGSVPLKTYLPDGDIDLTVIKGPNAEESLAHDVLALLQGEEQNENAEFQVKDTRFIDAEVKLVKCLVRDIVIDISFNQLGGLSTLCFLEQVDRLVGRNHLFKRSIILVKTWCYYESRILGAHHGLISTYALETLILYIFHFFHSSLGGPLAVLYRFLDYYSQFDWENYCISLKGPVCKSSLPDIIVKTPESGWNNLMLSEEFLEKCTEMFSVPSREHEANRRAFQTKHLNIIDPLKENNNLGRSVHKGNFYRIRSALKYGARKLGQVLLCPRDKVADGISEFFANTIARHGQHYRSSIRHFALEFGDEESLTASLSSPTELLSEDDMLLKSSLSDFDNDSVGYEDKPTLEFKNELERYSVGEILSDYTSSSNYSLSSGNLSHKAHSSKSSAENGSLEAYQIDLSGCTSQNGFYLWLENRNKYVEMNKTYQWCNENTVSSSSTQKANILENQTLDCIDIDSMSIGGDSEAFDPLANLDGDYDSHIRSLLYGQLCHGFTFSSPVVCNSLSPPSNFQTKKPWDVVRQSMPLRQIEFSSNPLSMEQTMYPAAADPAYFASAYCFEGKEKARGTGTYFPQTNAFYMERSTYGRGRNKVTGHRNQNHKYGGSNNLSGKSYSSENAAHERSKSQGRGRSNVPCQSPRGNGYVNASSCRIEFGSIGNLAKEFISCSPRVKGSTRGPSLEAQRSIGALKQERVAGRSIHLKSEDEFPSLSSDVN